MKVNIKHIILCLFTLVNSFGIAQEEEVSWSAETTEADKVEKKTFDQEAYEKIKAEVDLIEEMEKKRLEEDSSKFGEGYGVEKGDSYTIWEYDSVSGTYSTRESYRGSGQRNYGDGIQPDSRRFERGKRFQRRKAIERAENRRRQIEESRLKRQKEYEKDKPRQEKIDKEKRELESGKTDGSSAGGGFFKFLLILIIAVILGFAGFMLFAKGPMEGESSKILYDQEMNPDAVQLSELELKILAAKEGEDFRSATRLYFVWVIKELSDRGHIQWKKRKTNYHYQIEVQGQIFYNDFKDAVKNYEFIWYGKYEIGPDDFDIVEKHFKDLINKIKG